MFAYIYIYNIVQVGSRGWGDHARLVGDVPYSRAVNIVYIYIYIYIYIFPPQSNPIKSHAR